MPTRALTALGGLALLASLWLTWFSIDVDEDVIVYGISSVESSAWSLAWTDVVLATVALIALAALLRPVALRAIRVLGPLAVAVVGWELLTPPDGSRAALGIYAALAAAILATAASWWSRRAAA